MRDHAGPYGVERRAGVSMTTRDGVVLVADLYVPRHVDHDVPVLVRRTPYGRRLNDLAEEFTEAHFFASHGYLVVVQDTRGRGNSQGSFVPFEHEAEDGYDAIEWAATLDGSNGNVGTFGQSYGGIVQYLTASLRPPHLVTCIPISALMLAFDNYWYRSGALELNWALSYFLNMAEGAAIDAADTDTLEHLRAFKSEPEMRFGQLTPESLAHLPVGDWIPTLGEHIPYLAEVLHNDRDGAYWRRLDMTDRLDSIDIPMLHIGSWYDLANRDTVEYFRRLYAAAPERGHRLIMGPWAHLLPYHQPTSTGSGDIDFGPHAAVPMFLTQLDWFDKHLKNYAVDWIPAVQLFIMGHNVWRSEPAWPVPDTVATRWYLGHDRSATTDRSGLLLREPGTSATQDTFVYDPSDPVPTRGGHFVGGGVCDQRPTQERDDVLTYSSAVLLQPLEIIGPVSVELYATTSAVDTDFVALLCDVHPDGFAQNLLEGIVRGRFIQSFDEHHLLQPGTAYRFDIDLWNIAHVFAPGHLIRLHITSSDFPRWDRNLNGGEPQYSADTPVVAEQTILHGVPTPSCIVLPVVRRKAGSEVGGQLPSVATRHTPGRLS